MANVIISNKDWHRQLAKKLTDETGEETIFINDNNLVSQDYLSPLNQSIYFSLIGHI